MKKPSSKTEESKETRIPRTISLLPRHEQILADVAKLRPEIAKNASLLFQELLESVDPHTGRAGSYLEARDQAIDFEEDIAALVEEAGFTVRRNAKVNGNGHRVDLLVSSGKLQAVVELKSSGRRDRLELAIASAILLARQCGLPVTVCVPVVLEDELTKVFASLGVGLCTPGSLVPWLRDRLTEGGTV